MNDPVFNPTDLFIIGQTKLFFFPKRKDRVYYDPGSLGKSASFNSVRKNDIKI